MPVVSVISPRFRLQAAAGEQREVLNQPAALGPEPGAAQLIGEVSEPAEALGLRAGMRLGEALSRCPELALVPPDPERADLDWEGVMRRLEGIGAEVESELAGEAFFEAAGLRNLWGDVGGVLARARRGVGSWEGAPSEARSNPCHARLAAAPGRFCSYVAARRGSTGGAPPIVAEGSAREFLAPLPVSLLCGRLRPPGAAAGADDEAETDDLPNQLERLGVDTLGRLAELPRDAVADRFGRLGLRALRLARGGDWPLRPRRVREGLAVELELPDAVSGPQLERALELLIARLLAHRERRGRSVRTLRLSARLAAGGGWRRDVALRRVGTDRDRLAAALLPQLALLPAPAATLRLEAVALGSASGEQLTLADPEEQRHSRLSEAVRQARAAGGSEAVLRVLEVDPESRIPERRDVLMPWVEGTPQMRGGSERSHPSDASRSNPS